MENFGLAGHTHDVAGSNSGTGHTKYPWTSTKPDGFGSYTLLFSAQSTYILKVMSN